MIGTSGGEFNPWSGTWDSTRSQNIEQRQCCSRFNKDLNKKGGGVHIKKILKKEVDEEPLRRKQNMNLLTKDGKDS